MSLKRSKFLLVLFLAAFTVRLAAVAALRNVHHGPTGSMGADGIEYDALASRVAQGQGYGYTPGHPTSFRAPGFPFLLAGVFAAEGGRPRYVPVYLLFCAIGAAACVLTCLATEELGGQKLGRIAGALSVVYLPHIYYATEFDTENLFVFCLALALWPFLRHLRTGSAWSLGIAGLALGYAVLVRPFALLLVPVFLAVLAWHIWSARRKAPMRLAMPLLLAAAVAAPVLPWTLRNYRAHHHFVAVATNGGSTFYGANNDRVLHEHYYLGGWLSTVHLPGRNLIDAAPDEYTHDQIEWRLGKQWVRGHLASMPLLCVYKFVRLWLPDVASANKKYVAMQLVGYTPFLLLYLLAAVQFARNRAYWNQRWALIHGVLLATVLMALIFWGSPRFRDANMPVLMAYAAAGVSALAGWKNKGRSGSQLPATTVAA
jgi:4-amino-4-deoxy-L-arabinose transferase-like glycosyltransferase